MVAKRVQNRITNRQIVAELRHGRRTGYKHLCDQFQSRLLREAVSGYRIPRQEAEEIVNDTLLAVTLRIGKFQFRGSDDDFRLWVMTILRNRVRDHLRKSIITARVLRPIDEISALHEPSAEEHFQEVFVSIIRGREWETINGKPDRLMVRLTDALDRLEHWERVLLRCRATGVPYEEIAGLTGKTVSQLKVYHARVQRKLRRALGMAHGEID